MKENTVEIPVAKSGKRYWWKAVASFLIVLFTMPLGHALMIMMEHLLSPVTLHRAVFALGTVGRVISVQHPFRL